jgi:hypothetical protein
MVSMKAFYSEIKTSTFQSNNSVVSKLIWLELDVNLSHRYDVENPPELLDCQCSTAVGPNVVTVRNQSVSVHENDDTVIQTDVSRSQ